MLGVKLSAKLANVLANVVPAISAKISYAFWARTKRYARPEYEQACWQKAKKTILNADGEKVVVYSWGNGPPVLLIHGWNGRATQYFAFIEVLLAQGYQVIAFDAPGHGESSGHQTNLLQMMGIVKRLYKDCGEFEAIIAHSFGFFVAINSLSLGVSGKALIGVSSPADFNLLLKAFVRYFSLNAKAESALMALVKKRYNLESFDEVSIHCLAKRLKLPCLVVHDKNDRQVPISEAFKIVDAWQKAELYQTTGYGHTGVLRHLDVVEKCIAFLKVGRS